MTVSVICDIAGFVAICQRQLGCAYLLTLMTCDVMCCWICYIGSSCLNSRGFLCEMSVFHFHSCKNLYVIFFYWGASRLRKLSPFVYYLLFCTRIDPRRGAQVTGFWGPVGDQLEESSPGLLTLELVGLLAALVGV